MTAARVHFWVHCMCIIHVFIIHIISITHVIMRARHELVRFVNLWKCSPSFSQLWRILAEYNINISRFSQIPHSESTYSFWFATAKTFSSSLTALKVRSHINPDYPPLLSRDIISIVIFTLFLFRSCHSRWIFQTGQHCSNTSQSKHIYKFIIHISYSVRNKIALLFCV